MTSELSLPAFPDWRAQPRLVDGDLSFEPVGPLSHVPPVAHRAEWRTVDGGLAWAAQDLVWVVDAGVSIATRQVIHLGEFEREDFSGSLVLLGRVADSRPQVGPFGGGGALVEATSGEQLSLKGAGTPVSPGLGCASLGTPCPLTDGELTPISVGGASALTLQLARPVVVSAIVLRGLELEVPLVVGELIGADGGQFVSRFVGMGEWRGPRFVAPDDGGTEFTIRYEPQFVTMSFDAGEPASAVRVVIPFNGGLSRISEISVFE